MASFLQSREWEEIQNAMGRTTARIGSVLLIRHDLPLGFRYLYAPRPIVSDGDAFLDEVAEYARGIGAMFLRVEPERAFSIQHSIFNIAEVEGVQPRKTIVLALSKSDAELLSAMHPKTRYNIRLAERHGVAVRWEEGSGAVRKFYGLLRETGVRDRFRLHPERYYEVLAAKRSPEFSNLLAFAYHNGELAAAAMINAYRGRATYLHGASAHALRHAMAPQLLHWEVMRAMCSRGCRTYDLWGIDERRWPGITRFKLGFGGMEVSHPPAYDVVFRSVPYALYRLQHDLRRRAA